MTAAYPGLDPGPLPATVAECKALLRLDRDDDDALIAGFLRTATALCEAFTGQALIVRAGVERVAAGHGWRRLVTRPIVAIDGVDGPSGPLAATAYEADIDAAGLGWLCLPGVCEVVTVRFRAGLAADWNGVPEPLRAGIVRLVAHFHTHRDAADAGPPPAAVAALWRPWRVVRL